MTATLEKKVEEITFDKSKTRTECIKEILDIFNTASMHMKNLTLSFWKIGFIIDALTERGEKNVIEEVMAKTKYEKRTIQYTLAVYRKFPEYTKVEELCSKGFNWSHFKELSTASIEDKDRNTILDKVLADEIEVDEAIKEASSKKKEKKEKEKADAEDPTDNKLDLCGFFEKYKNLASQTKTEFKRLIVQYPDYTKAMLDADVVDDEDFLAGLASIKAADNEIKSLVKMLTDINNNFDKDFLSELEK